MAQPNFPAVLMVCMFSFALMKMFVMIPSDVDVRVHGPPFFICITLTPASGGSTSLTTLSSSKGGIFDLALSLKGEGTDSSLPRPPEADEPVAEREGTKGRTRLFLLPSQSQSSFFLAQLLHILQGVLGGYQEQHAQNRQDA
jgi:hypothetical protein